MRQLYHKKSGNRLLPENLLENIRNGPSSPDQNRTTNFEYLAGSMLHRMTILNSSTGTQVTEWFYGTEQSITESQVATGHLLRAKKYPGDTNSTCLRWRYNRAGEVTHQTDANGTVRLFLRDRLGRLVNDIADAYYLSGS